MPNLKKTKFLKNLKGWATVNIKKRKQEDQYLDKENLPTCHSPKKARPKPPNSNAGQELHNVPQAVSVVSPCSENMTLTLPAPMTNRTVSKSKVTAPSDDIAHEHGMDASKPVNDAGSASDNSDEEQENVEFHYEKIRTHQFAPTIAEAGVAFADIKRILKPPRKKGHGYDPHGLDELTHGHVEAMHRFLWKYIAGNSTIQWIAASLETAHDHEWGPYHACLLCEWTHTFIANRNDLPKNIYGTWKTSMLDDKDFAQAIHLHLQSLGPWI
ncbi:hypothetical protein APHAL10511_008687 [Amanita phalloides]|nr:hypothetical protein APHAL10511_008687 [Amanita phalloides]